MMIDDTNTHDLKNLKSEMSPMTLKANIIPVVF